MTQSVHNVHYFEFVLTWLKAVGVPIRPLNTSLLFTILYSIYSAMFLVVFALGFLVSQIYELPNAIGNLKRLMFGMGYIFSDSLGKRCFLFFTVIVTKHQCYRYYKNDNVLSKAQTYN